MKECKYLFPISVSSLTYSKTSEKYQSCLQNFLFSNRVCVFQVLSVYIVLSEKSKYSFKNASATHKPSQHHPRTIQNFTILGTSHSALRQSSTQQTTILNLSEYIRVNKRHAKKD